MANEEGLLTMTSPDIPMERMLPVIDETLIDTQLNDVLSIENTIDQREGFKQWFGRHKTKLAVGAAAVGLAITLTNNPISELKDDVVDAAPWVGAGVAASEVAFTIGAGMMLGAVGEKIGNPLKVKERIPAIAQKANNSKLFKTGFVINTVGAVGDFVVLSGGVVKEMPVESYPVLGLTLLDLGLTVAVRKAIHRGVKNNSADPLTVSEADN
jgi:hypothetical protein